MLCVIDCYREGTIARGGFCSEVARIAVPEEIQEFLEECPPDLLEALQKDLAVYGEDEFNWPRTFCIACHAPWLTPEQIEEAQRQEQEAIWNGVRLLKRYIS
jgi:hypothetical protein